MVKEGVYTKQRLPLTRHGFDYPDDASVLERLLPAPIFAGRSSQAEGCRLP